MCSNKSAVSTYHEEGSGARSFGYLIIAGPIYGQERACLSGQRCTLRNMEGYGLTEQDRMRIAVAQVGLARDERIGCANLARQVYLSKIRCTSVCNC